MVNGSLEISGLLDTPIRLSGDIDINVEDNAILIVANSPEGDEDVRIEFDDNTSSEWIKGIADCIESVVASDEEAYLVIEQLSKASNDFITYVRDEIGNAHLDDNLFVLDVGTGIYVTSHVEII